MLFVSFCDRRSVNKENSEREMPAYDIVLVSKTGRLCVRLANRMDLGCSAVDAWQCLEYSRDIQKP